MKTVNPDLLPEGSYVAKAQVVYVPSRSDPDAGHIVIVNLEHDAPATLCNCIGFRTYGYCWASSAVLEASR